MATEPQTSGRGLLREIETFSRALKPVDTQLTTADGRKYVEKRGASGSVLVEAAGRGMGFCPDYSPDRTVGVAMEGLLVGSQDVASDLLLLRELKVTHILNVATSIIPCAFPQDFTYRVVEMFDDSREDLLLHYAECESFIEDSRSNGGTVLVHCNAGVSRSSSVALAYMMHKERLSLEQAYDRLRLTRPKIQPNPSFMEQLTQMQHKLGIDA